MKKGFTLIELLAVIVILAIIAVIATPIVVQIIDDAENNANQRSVEMNAKSIEQAVAKYQLSNPQQSLLSEVFTASNGGKTLTSGEKTLQVEYEGPEIICNSIKINKKGKIKLSECTIDSQGNYSYGDENGLYTCSLTTETYNECFYEDCSQTVEVVKCGTEEFYVLEKNESTITMITAHELDLKKSPYLQKRYSNGSTTFYSNDGSTEPKIYGYVNAYGEYLKNILWDGGLISIGLLTTYNTSFPVGSPFWTSVVNDDGTIMVLEAYFGASHDSWSGFYPYDGYSDKAEVRPVITISTSIIDK